MKAVILAAGEGRRMRPLTYTRPKVMLPVANKPILEYVVEALAKAGIRDIVIVVGYKDNVIRDYFNDGKNWNVKIKYVFQKRSLGTAHALMVASHLLNDDFLMLNGDSIVSREDIKRVVDSEYAAIAVTEVKDPKNYGVVEVESDKVKRIVEKPENPTANTVNAGIYRFTPEILDFVEKTPLSKRGEYEITDTIQLAINSGVEFKAVKIDTWIDVGYPWQLLDANEFLLKRQEMEVRGEVEEGAHITGNVAVGEGTVIKAGAYIVGPVIIGKNCVVGPNCFIRPYTSIGDNCHIGNAVEIKNSIIMSNTNVPHLNYVGDSVVGENCNFGAGTKIANLRLDGGVVYAKTENGKISTGRRKFGAVVGDNVKTGINVSINVGSMIGNDVFVAPSAVVDGYVKPHSRVF